MACSKVDRGGAMQLAGLVLCVAGAFGCGDGVTVNNHNPKGTVGALILDGATQQPLPGVTVTLLSAGGTFHSGTAADGFFRTGAVPAGAFTMQLSKDGYVPVSVQGNLVGTNGNFPIANPLATLGPIGLAPVGPDFVVRVADSNGAAVAGVTGTLRNTFSYVDYSSTVPSGGHLLRITAEGLRPYQSDVAIQDAQDRTLDITLEKEQSRGGVPAWAWVVGGAVVASAAGVGAYFVFKPEDKQLSAPTGTGPFGGGSVQISRF